MRMATLCVLFGSGRVATFQFRGAMRHSLSGRLASAPQQLRYRGGMTQASAVIDIAVPLSKVQIKSSEGSVSSWKGDMLLLPFWETNTTHSLSNEVAALDAQLDGAVSALIEENDFKGKVGTSAATMLPRAAPFKKIAVLGLGKSEDFSIGSAKKWGELVASCCKAQKCTIAAAVLPTLVAEDESPISPSLQQVAVEAALLALSPDTRYKSNKDDDDVKPPAITQIDVLGQVDSDALRRASTIASGVLLTRGLVGSPANYLTPKAMADAARSLAEQFEHLELTVLDQAECEARGMGAYLGVSQGALEPPQFIHLKYSPIGSVTKRLALIGKGLTFDSGGYNIKAGAGSMIEKMKFDMGGAGAVLGAARVIGELAPPNVEVNFIIAACENMVSDRAMRPGDILTASNQKTIEVANTDAEGRLTLADALVYAEGLGKMDAIVDIATLTGACIIALGPDYGGLWSSNDVLADQLLGSAKASGEHMWRMPLANEYMEQIKSPIADLKNVGDRGGGSITAALFLKEFVKESPWAHLDIAGPVWNDKAGGATGYAVRTLSHFVEQQSL
eukprot:CAMPEP_0119346048 /NCGR_PEP_ID=MMETSP1333-20130426/107799_1 /TAXON_ID=418940 /ORGANISM="Scyphosphaera apsteinii, Strain RCC1455" /LENGTH=561 /DNA_ID=CAMNT_0007358543 /DNA_START=33 /DNA_END=1718 /DNA_ORIENTATION=-